MPPKKTVGFRFSEATQAQLDSLVESSGRNQTQVVEWALGMLWRAVEATGGRADGEQVIDEALACWRTASNLASLDNAGHFSREEWNCIADVCNGTLWPYEITGTRPGTLLAIEIEDGHRLNGTGYNWFCEGDGCSLTLTPEERDYARDRVADLVRKLAALDFVHGWAVIQAVRWFWNHTELQIDHARDEWWHPGFRRNPPSPSLRVAQGE